MKGIIGDAEAILLVWCRKDPARNGRRVTQSEKKAPPFLQELQRRVGHPQ